VARTDVTIKKIIMGMLNFLSILTYEILLALAFFLLSSVSSSAVLGTFKGIITSMGTSTVKVSVHASIVPNAESSPRCLIGLSSVVAKLKKPILVVIEVRRVGPKFLSMVSLALSILSMPCFRPCQKVTRI